MTTPDPRFVELVHARSAALHRAAYLMVGDVGLAQDLVQEALVKTYAAWPRLRDPGSAEAYCRKAITTTAISWLRRRRWTHERLTTDGGVPDAGLTGHESGVTERAWLWQGLRRLPARQRIAVVLRYYEDLAEAQTAEAMGCAVGTVKSQVHAGLATLRVHLAEVGLDDVLPVLPVPAGGTR